MKNFYSTKDLEDEVAQELIKWIGETEGELCIYFRSNGGKTRVARVLLDVMNREKERITLKAVELIYSSAFWLFFEFEGRREIMRDIVGMFHLSRFQPYTASDGKIVYDDDIIMSKQDVAENYPADIEFCQKLGFTKKEMKILKRREDVYFTRIKLQEMLDNQIKND